MPLVSDHFRDNVRLNECLVNDSAHVTPGQSGDYVTLIQDALQIIDGAAIAPGEIDARIYGPVTAAAVLSYKRKRDIVNRAYQSAADDIVGRMTIAALDREMLARQQRPRPTTVEYFYEAGVVARHTQEYQFAVAGKKGKKPAPAPGPAWPVTDLSIKLGETKILALKRFNLGPPPEVVVQATNTEVAFCFQSGRLKDPSKVAYIDILMSGMNDAIAPIELNGNFYFQICGRNVGVTELKASRRSGGDYARTVKVTVQPNPKALALGASFQTLWNNHPLQPQNGSIGYPCWGTHENKFKAEKNPPLYNMQCMVRLCWALHQSNVNLSGMIGFSACRVKGTEHKFHFSDPYDFMYWTKARGQSFDWTAHKPYAPEPMPGLAAFWFVRERTGIIVFDHYFNVKGREAMFGGHIDLWNKTTMGNTIGSGNVYEGLSAFLRSRTIRFWPID